MGNYCFRYRIRALTPPKIEGVDSTITLPDLPPINVSVADAHPSGKWVIFRAWGFDTVEAAADAGKLFGDVLLLTGATGKLGFDLGFSRSTLQFSEEIHSAVRSKEGRELRTEVHGLMTYEKDTVSIVGLDARGSSHVSSSALQDSLRKWQTLVGKITDRQRTCASLINDSFFAQNIEGQFVLRVSAVEALCKQSKVATEHQAVLDEIKRFASSLDMEPNLRSAINSMLLNAKTESVGQAYRAKFRKLLSDEDGRAFGKLYGRRSRLLHEGFGRGELGEASNMALDLSAKLLEADVIDGHG